MLPSACLYCVGALDEGHFAAQYPGPHVPCERLACVLTDAHPSLGADVVRYSFIVRDFHPLLLAGFDRRTKT